MTKKIIQFPGQVEGSGASSLESTNGIKGGSSEDEIEGELESDEESDRQKVVKIRRDFLVSPDNPQQESKRLVDLGLSVISRLNILEARHYFKQATEIDKTNADAFYNLALTYTELDYAIAETYFIRALVVNSSLVEIYFCLASMYNGVDEAKAYFYFNLFLEKSEESTSDSEIVSDRLAAKVLLKAIEEDYPEFKK